MNELTISDAELADNPTARVPICVLLDVSQSMAGDPIRELNEGVYGQQEQEELNASYKQSLANKIPSTKNSSLN